MSTIAELELDSEAKLITPAFNIKHLNKMATLSKPRNQDCRRVTESPKMLAIAKECGKSVKSRDEKEKDKVVGEGVGDRRVAVKWQPGRGSN